MNKPKDFFDHCLTKAISLKEKFKILEKNDWNSLTVLLELNVQIGHLVNVVNDDIEIHEDGREIDNIGDEISDVLLQLSYLSHIEKINFDNIEEYNDYHYDKIEGLSILSGQLTEILMEKYEYRFDKPRVGFKTNDEFIKDRIIKMIIISLNIGNKYNLDMIKEFNDMCENALGFLSKKVTE